MSEDFIIIDGKRYILDPKGQGEYALATNTQEHLDNLTPTEADLLPGVVPSYDATWLQQMEARVGSNMCLLPGCPKGNRGGRSKFCSYRHERTYAARRYRRRQHGVTRWVESVNGIPVRFERKFPRGVSDAKKYFEEHIADGVCQYAGSYDCCPSFRNPYGDPNQARCIIYATFADDLMVWKARNLGLIVRRRYTTTDGQWLADDELPWTPPNSS